MLIFRVLADAVLVIHFLFILFVLFGGLLAWRWPKIAWAHVPAFLWGALVETLGWICPLTPLEIWLRLKAGQPGYTGGFIAHYIEPLVYPPGLERWMQIVLAGVIVVGNGILYGIRWRRRGR
jgi:hypothetical protein